MKLLLVFLLTFQAFAYESKSNQPDFLVHSKSSHNWHEFLIDKVQTFLFYNDYKDPFNVNSTNTMTIEESLFDNTPDSPAKKLIHRLAKLLKIKDISQVKLRIEIDNYNHEINNASFDMIPSSLDSGAVNLVTEIKTKQLKFNASEVRLTLVLPNRSGDMEDFLSFKLIDPKLTTPEDSELALDFEFNLHPESNFEFEYVGGDFTKLNDFITSQKDKIKFTTQIGLDPNPFPLLNLNDQKVWILTDDEDKLRDRIKNDQFNLGIFLASEFNIYKNTSEVKVIYTSIAKYIEDNIDTVKELILDITMKKIQEGLGNNILKNIEKLAIEREFWIKSWISAQFHWDKFQVVNDDLFEFEFSGHYCNEDEMKQFGNDCYKMQDYPAPVREISNGMLERSKDKLRSSVTSGQADLTISASEDYLNRMLRETYDAGGWDVDLVSNNLKMNEENPHPMFLILDKAGYTADLYLDIMYTGLTKFQKFALGEKVIKIPVKLKTYVEMISVDNIPTLFLTVVGADMSSEFLLNGAPEYGLNSGIKNMKRFKKVVLKVIKNEMNAIIGEKLELPIPELKDLPLDKAIFSSDGLGRIVAKFKITNSRKFSFVPLTKEENPISIEDMIRKSKKGTKSTKKARQ